MSVIAPWQKKNPGLNAVPRLPPSNVGKPKAKRVWVVLILLFLVAAYLCARLIMAYVLQKALVCQWEEARLLCAMGDRYVLETPSAFQVGSVKGTVDEVPKDADDTAMLTTHGLVIADLSRLWLAQGECRDELMHLQPGTKMLRHNNQGEIVMAVPSQEDSYGETWILCTAGLEGSQYQWVVPSVPIMTQSLGTQMFVATMDIETGGTTGLYCFVQGETQKKWSRSLGFGMWRHLLVNQNCILAVLDSGIEAYSFDGDLLWSFDAPGKVVSADLSGDSVVMTWMSSGGNLQDLSSRSGVLLMSKSGEILWRRSMPGRFLKARVLEDDSSGDQGSRIISVLSETSVTWIRAEDGRDILTTKTSGLPVHAGKDFILVKKGLGLQLIAKGPLGG